MNKLFIAISLIFFTGCSAFQLKSSHFIPAQPNEILIRLKQPKSGNHIALLVGANSEERHRNNISLAYQILIEQGYDRKDIFILDSEGGNPAIYPITDSLTKRTLHIMSEWLSENLSKSDTFFLYVTGHGEKNFLPLNKGEKISKQTFMSYFVTLNVKSGIIFFDQCYWGAPNIESTYVFISATSDFKTSFGTGFPRLFWQSFRRLQGNVSVLEAFEFAKENDSGYLHGHQNPELSYTRVSPKEINLLGETIRYEQK